METRQENNGIDPMLVLGNAVDMSVKVRGGDFPLGAIADEDSENHQGS